MTKPLRIILALWALTSTAFVGWPEFVLYNWTRNQDSGEESVGVAFMCAGICALVFASGWLLSKFGQNWTVRALALAVLPLPAWFIDGPGNSLAISPLSLRAWGCAMVLVRPSNQGASPCVLAIPCSSRSSPQWAVWA